MAVIAAHDLVRSRDCAEQGCEEEAAHELAGSWYCDRHMPRCAMAGCTRPAFIRRGKSWACEQCHEKVNAKISAGIRRRMNPEPPAPEPAPELPAENGNGPLSAVAAQLAPVARRLDQAAVRYREARTELEAARAEWEGLMATFELALADTLT